MLRMFLLFMFFMFYMNLYEMFFDENLKKCKSMMCLMMLIFMDITIFLSDLLVIFSVLFLSLLYFWFFILPYLVLLVSKIVKIIFFSRKCYVIILSK